MNRLNLQRVLLFVCVLAIIAVVIYKGQTHREEQKREQAAREETKVAEEQRKTEEEAAAKAQKNAAATAHARFVNQYVNTNFTRTPGMPLIAVAVAAENRTMNHTLSVALISRFKGEHAKLVDSFFKPPLVSDGLFDDTFNGSSTLFNKLEITDSVDALLLARQSVEYSTNAELDNVITANMRVEMVTLPVAGQVESQGWTFTASGVGFRRPEARLQAEERIIKQIMEKTNMALGLLDPKH